MSLNITAWTLVNALGYGADETWGSIVKSTTGLKKTSAYASIETWVGEVEGLENYRLSEEWSEFDCRNNRLARATLECDGFQNAVEKAKDIYGADRIGVFLGTSTSGIAETERAYRNRDSVTGRLPDDYDFQHTHNIGSLLLFVKSWLGLKGHGVCISTACSSSSKVFASAYRSIQVGLCDAAVVGGVDSLCETTLYGFNSLQLVSTEQCRPWGAARCGINIGEGGGFVLLEKDNKKSCSGICLLGYGETSDAYHMSTPHPEGIGAQKAMIQAINTAGCKSTDIDYINLHGTATRSNDLSEDIAITSVFGSKVRCSSTKAWTGHTLGAAGITESIISMLSLENGYLPECLNIGEKDPSLSANILFEPETGEIRYVLSNSFGFGGSNCSLIFGRNHD